MALIILFLIALAVLFAGLFTTLKWLLIIAGILIIWSLAGAVVRSRQRK